MSDTSAATHSVTRETGPDRFEIAVDGSAAGLARFVDADGQRIFFHTEVDDAYAGQGLAGALVGAALDATRAEGLRIVPVCPYVKKYVAKHTDYADIVDPVTPRSIETVEGATR